MRSLVVAPWVPFPPVFGSAVRTFHSIRMLASFSDVTLLSYATAADDDGVASLRQYCERVEVVPSGRRSSSIRRVRSMVSRHSFQYLAAWSVEMQRAIDDLAREMSFDVAKVDMTPMGRFRLPSDAAHVLDLHNLEHEVASRRVSLSAGRVRRAALQFEAAKLRSEEIGFCREADLVLTTSDRETEIARTWDTGAVVETLVNSVDTGRFEATVAPASSGPPRLVFIGTLHYEPNRDALHHFTTEIFPLVRAAVPDVEFEIVGGGDQPDIAALGRLPGITFTGFVDDVRDVFRRASALVVPLRSGGGTRLKILEAMAAGVPVVSTTIGAEGLDLIDCEDLLIADHPTDFAACAISLLQDRAFARRIAEQGCRRVRESYDWRSLTPRLEGLVREAVVNRKNRPRNAAG